MRKQNYFKRDRSSRKSRLKQVLWAVFIMLILYRIVLDTFGDMGFVKYSRMKNNRDTLTKDIAALKQDNTRLRREVRALKTDPDYLETIARDKLGFARRGEIVYYYGNLE